MSVMSAINASAMAFYVIADVFPEDFTTGFTSEDYRNMEEIEGMMDGDDWSEEDDANIDEYYATNEITEMDEIMESETATMFKYKCRCGAYFLPIDGYIDRKNPSGKKICRGCDVKTLSTSTSRPANEFKYKCRCGAFFLPVDGQVDIKNPTGKKICGECSKH